jgi:uncharacterized damage-inducible protein DinB
MAATLDLRASVLAAWRTNCRVTAFLVEEVPATLWSAAVPGAPARTVRMMLAHLHTARARWIGTLGRPHGVPAPPLVDRRRVGRRELLAALKRSGRGIEALLVLGLDANNRVPPSPVYVWRNLPLDVGHVLTYFVAHEAHHRGQIVMLARQLGHRLPAPVTNGLWQWTTRQREWERAPDARRS